MVVRLLNWLEAALAALSGIIVIGLTIIVNTEVLSRLITGISYQWVICYAEYGIVFLVFFSASWVLSRDRHVKVDIVLNLLSPAAQNKVNIITSVIGAITYGIFFWFSLQQTLWAFNLRIFEIRGVTLPLGPLYAVMPLGSLFLVLRFLRRAWLYATKRKVLEVA